MDKEELLKKWFINHPEIELAMLFGSYAKGTATKHSDVDIAIQLSDEGIICAEKKMAYLNQLSQIVDTMVDIVDLKTVGQPLLAQIMKYGKCLVGSKEVFTQLAIRNVNSTEDFTPNIERMLKERRMRWLANG